MIVSGQIRVQAAQYVGIINGVVYRIDSNMSLSGERVELVPLQVQSIALNERIAPLETVRRQPNMLDAWPAAIDGSDTTKTPPDPADAQATVVQAPDQEPVNDFRLFSREGPEPLRAGHPDLWHLLVAGTCLEGTTFRST
jgi:hypothetical protein